ncbi:hypothetical protein BC936DRAFT_150041, partial [Jimgerdemannia flammicorona]
MPRSARLRRSNPCTAPSLLRVPSAIPSTRRPEPASTGSTPRAASSTASPSNCATVASMASSYPRTRSCPAARKSSRPSSPLQNSSLRGRDC